MDGARLTARLLVQAGLRLCAERGIPAVVVRSGDPDAGAICVKVNQRDQGCSVMVQAHGVDGRTVWLSATGDQPVDEREADDVLARHRARDPDLWVLEVEDRGGYNPFVALTS